MWKGVSLFCIILYTFTNANTQVWSLSYHPASGNIAVGLADGRVEMWQTDPRIAPSASQAALRSGFGSAPQATFQAAPRAFPQAVPHADDQFGHSFAPQAASPFAPVATRPVRQSDPRPATSYSIPAHVCVRERLAAAQAQANDIQAALIQTHNAVCQQMSREQQLKRSIADLEAKCAYKNHPLIYTLTVCLVASEKRALQDVQTPEYFAQIRYLTELKERDNTLRGIINVCTQTLDSLTDCLSISGLEDLRGDAFREWLCDIGMSKLQTALKDIDGNTLTMLNVDSTLDYSVTFNDAAALQLRGYIAHCKLSDDRNFAPPRGSVLSWTPTQTANWIKTLGDPYVCLASAGWHGAALCSLSPPRIVTASNSALKANEAVRFIGLVRKVRNETDSDKDDWVAKWSGVSTIETQAIV